MLWHMEVQPGIAMSCGDTSVSCEDTGVGIVVRKCRAAIFFFEGQRGGEHPHLIHIHFRGCLAAKAITKAGISAIFEGKAKFTRGFT